MGFCGPTISVKMSADLCWAIVRDNHAYLLKKRTVQKPFSTEPNNLKNVNSARYNGFCPKKVVGITAAEGARELSSPTRQRNSRTNLVRTLLRPQSRLAPAVHLPEYAVSLRPINTGKI